MRRDQRRRSDLDRRSGGGAAAARRFAGRVRAGRRRTRRAALPSCARAPMPDLGLDKEGRMNDVEARASASSRCSCSASCCSTIRCSRCSTCRATLFGVPVALRVHLRRLGGADRADGLRRRIAGLDRAPRRGARHPMLQGPVIILVVVRLPRAAVRHRLLRRPARRRRPLGHRQPVHLRLSLAVYATAWTFYGSVGRAASDGIGFLPIYIGPTLMIALWWLVMRKIIRITKQNRITSLADFIASRYGKSALLGRPGDGDRGDRHPALHLAAAEGDLDQLHDPAAVSRDHHAGEGRRRAAPARTPRSGWR